MIERFRREFIFKREKWFADQVVTDGMGADAGGPQLPPPEVERTVLVRCQNAKDPGKVLRFSVPGRHLREVSDAALRRGLGEALAGQT
jgi:hypothetical protein